MKKTLSQNLIDLNEQGENLEARKLANEYLKKTAKTMRLDTRKKEYKKRLEAYLLNSICEEYFSYTHLNFKNYNNKEKIIALFEDMRNIYNFPYNLKIFPNEQMRLSDHLQGAPSSISIPIYNYDILQLVANLHNVDLEEIPTKTQETILKNFHNIIALSLLRLENKLIKNK